LHWEDEYRTKKRPWGEGPSELARAVVECIRKTRTSDAELSILDVGCGYGRDALYYADTLNCRVLGIDTAAKGIEIALGAASEREAGNVNFERRDFRDGRGDKYDIICASNLYQLLRPEQRRELRETVKESLLPGGLFFLSTLSVDDPEHFGEGAPIDGEANSYSYQHRVYLHFCTAEELKEDFRFLTIKELYEHEYDEPHADGNAHHHISWILAAENSEGENG